MTGHPEHYRRRVLFIRLTEDEHAAFTEQAQSRGLSLAACAREALAPLLREPSPSPGERHFQRTQSR